MEDIRFDESNLSLLHLAARHAYKEHAGCLRFSGRSHRRLSVRMDSAGRLIAIVWHSTAVLQIYTRVLGVLGAALRARC
jgi:hypothetical protein